MRKINIIGLSLLGLVLILSCSTHKNKFLNRNYHALVTKYNILYNGQEAYKKGLKAIKDSHQDNFWKRLPVEAITFDESKEKLLELKSSDDKQEGSNSPFERAEEKATKAIQRHSMNIGGYERNSQIDDAYLLLGKSRYYTQRFIPAIDAFNYIMWNYPNANLNYESRIWRAKSNARLGNEELAIETMNLLLDVLDQKENIPPRIVEDAYTAMAMAYSQTDTIQKTIKYLKKATETSYNKEQTGRNLFVLGQIYNELNEKDSARIVFKRIAKTRKFSDKYRIHANIELAKLVSKDDKNSDLIERFEDLVDDSDNRKYYDELYYQLGNLYEKINPKKALENYEKSLRAKDGSAYQKTYTYEGIGNLYFNKQDYLLAESYYDSVLQVVPKKYATEKRIRRVKRKNKGLASLKKYDLILKTNDSVLKITSMNKEEQKAFFEKHIEKLKEQDDLRRQQLANSQNFTNSFGKLKSKGKWYFYSASSKQLGRTEFKRIWGTRKLEDNWRWASQSSLITNQEDKELTPEKQNRYDLDTYLNAIPTDEKVLNKLKEDRNEALYNLGLIYKEQFKNTKLAIKYLERLEKINTNKDYELPIHYHLYQLYTNEGDMIKANLSKNYILNNYPLSKYVELLKNNKKVFDNNEVKEDEVSKRYKEIYYLYKKGEYQEVINQIDNFSERVNQSDLIPKFALLKAMAVGKIGNKEEYLKLLEFITYNYADSVEGKKAKEIIKLIRTKK